MIEKAKNKIQSENLKGPEAEVQQMILCWLECDDRAAGMVLQEGKTAAGAYEAIKTAARKKSRNTAACVNPPEAMAIVLEYFGMDRQQAEAEIEDSLMYRIIMAYSKTWQPYAAQGGKNEKTQPAADSAKGGLDLSSFSLEAIM